MQSNVRVNLDLSSFEYLHYKDTQKVEVLPSTLTLYPRSPHTFFVKIFEASKDVKIGMLELNNTVPHLVSPQALSILL